MSYVLIWMHTIKVHLFYLSCNSPLIIFAGIEIDCNGEASTVCKQMIRFFELLTIPSTADTSITQELLSLVTGLAQNLKSLIRIGLSAALHLVSETLIFFFHIVI